MPSETLVTDNHPFSVGKKGWFAVYTRSRYEKSTADELELQQITVYLPMYRTLRVWTDRRKRVTVPLIRSYLFVHIGEPEYMKVLHTPGVVKIISFSGRPAPIPDWQINNLRILIGAGVPVADTPVNYKPGNLVTIAHGALTGLCGTVVSIRARCLIVISITALNYNLSVEIDPVFVVPAGGVPGRLPNAQQAG